MRYIKIQNSGEIEPNSFKLIGASTKRGQDGKIGYFGSGLKYSIAFLLRNNHNFRVFSGKNEIVIGTKFAKHRDQEFSVITIGGDDTSMTTSMGPDWTSWGALREIYCNAIDEGMHSIETVTEDQVSGEDGITNIFIKLDRDFVEILEKWDYYFSDNRSDIVQTHVGCRVFGGSSHNLVIYRRGIQCHTEPTECALHYDMDWCMINESRVLDSIYMFKHTLTQWIFNRANANTIGRILTAIDEKNVFEASLHWDSYTIYNKEVWVDAINGRTLVSREIAGWFSEQLQVDRYKYLILPMKLASELNKQLGIPMLGFGCGGEVFAPVELDARGKFMLNEVRKFFNEAGYEINYPIVPVKFQNNGILGLADDGTIYISEKLFEQGKKKLAETIFEENEHLNTGYGDCSRSFQTYLINKIISGFEERCAFFL